MKNLSIILVVVSLLAVSCKKEVSVGGNGETAQLLKQASLTSQELNVLVENGISVNKSASLNDLINDWQFVGFLKTEGKNVVFQDSRAKFVNATYTETLTHEGNFVFSANGPINSVNAQFDIDRGRIYYSEINRTRISGRPELIEFEDVFFKNLLAPVDFYAHHDILILENPETHMKMLFTAR